MNKIKESVNCEALFSFIQIFVVNFLQILMMSQGFDFKIFCLYTWAVHFLKRICQYQDEPISEQLWCSQMHLSLVSGE